MKKPRLDVKMIIRFFKFYIPKAVLSNIQPSQLCLFLWILQGENNSRRARLG